MKPATVDKFFRRFAALDAEPKTELNYINTYTLLIAVVLSAQATDVAVNKATAALFKKVQTPQEMVRLGEDGLKKHIKTIGLFNAKAKNIVKLSQILIDSFDSKVPDTRENLESLPGVGRKTANIILNICFGQPTLAVDTHVFRVANRTGMAAGNTPEEVEEELLRVIPNKWLRHAHHWLILHGRYVCKARVPLCPQCVVRDLCEFKNKTV